VILRDIVGTGSSGSFVVFDAVRFTSADNVGTDEPWVTYPTQSTLDISRAYPNPFNPRVTVEYELKHSDQQVSAFVTDLKGQHIKSIKKFYGSKGRHKISWNGDNDHGDNVPAGLYFLSIKAGNTIRSAKILLLE
jgi:flagellar hook assembly protein FlgD